MTDRKQQDLCLRGNQADALYNEGRYREALVAYTRLLKEMEKSGTVDSYLVAKATLAVLLTQIRLGQLQEAVSVWTAQMEDSLFGIGIYGIEHAQTTVHDLICYDFICAYLHTVTAANKDEASEAVNQYMSRICEYLIEQDEKEMLRLALSNWKQHLNEIHGSRPPLAFVKPLIEIEKAFFGEPVRLQSIGFPQPADWERPAGFEEMSRVLEHTSDAPKTKRLRGA